MPEQIEHVSDTALLVAASRASESEREDRLTFDPFASRLAGDRGMALARNVPGSPWIELGIGLRTRFLDELITAAIADGTDSVLSLGAGLDARPWRLNLPANLCWTEVDFPAMLDYKYSVLAAERPKCRLERRSADLNNASERQNVMASAALHANEPLLLTEGLLMYLPSETVRALAIEARDAGFRFWLMDSNTTELMQRAHGDQMQQIDGVRADTHLEGPEIRKLVEQQGWKALNRRLYVEEAPKLARARIQKIIEAEGRPFEQPQDDGSGVWLFTSET